MQRLPGVPADVDADLVDEPERTHRHSELLRGVVDGFDTGPVGEEEARLVQVRAQNAIHQKAGAVVGHHRHFSEREGERIRRGYRVVAAPRPAHDFNQRHPVDRVEEVHADEVLRPGQGRRHLVHGQRRRVRGQYTRSPNGFLGLPQYDPLDVHLFYDRFDNQVLPDKSLVSQTTGYECHLLIRLTAAKPSPFYEAAEELLGVLESAGDRIMANVLHAHVNAPVGSELCDSTSHHAGPEHRKVLYASGLHALVLHSGALTCVLPEVKDVDQILGDGCCDEFSGGLRLDLESLHEGLFRAPAHDLENLQMRRVVASRQPHHILLCEEQDQPAARGGAVLEAL